MCIAITPNPSLCARTNRELLQVFPINWVVPDELVSGTNAIQLDHANGLISGAYALNSVMLLLVFMYVNVTSLTSTLPRGLAASDQEAFERKALQVSPMASKAPIGIVILSAAPI